MNMKEYTPSGEIKQHGGRKVSSFEGSGIELDLLNCHRGAHDTEPSLSTPQSGNTRNTLKPKAGPNCVLGVTLRACELNQLTMISDRIVRWQEHADRNLALIEEHLLWCRSCAGRLNAVAASLERVLRAGGDGSGPSRPH